MKVYVVAYRTDDLERSPTEVRYGLEPTAESRYVTRALAVTDCMLLNSHRLSIGAHCCAFTVDDLPTGDFGIICTCHPPTFIGEAMLEH